MRNGQVTHVFIQHDIRNVLGEADALPALTDFEAVITRALERQLHDEVIQDLVKKRLRRITKTKSRGFKSDLKKLKGKKKDG